MFGRRQLRRLVQQLTFLVSGLAFIVGVASAYVAESSAPSDDEQRVMAADVSEEMGETSDAADIEDELNDWVGHDPLVQLHPAPLAGTVGFAPADLIPPSPFRDPLMRPPCFA